MDLLPQQSVSYEVLVAAGEDLTKTIFGKTLSLQPSALYDF